MNGLQFLPFVLVTAVLCAVPAQAQQTQPGPRCAPTPIIETLLSKQYREVQAGRGIARSTLYRIFLSEKGTFTFTATNVKTGITCMLGDGEGWEFIEPDFDSLDPKT